MNYKTKVVKSWDGFHQVELSIGCQSFLFEEKKGYEGEMTSREHAEWYKTQLDKALSCLLNSENEISVSDVEQEHGDLHDVRICNAERESESKIQTSGELPLRSITDDGNNFFCRGEYAKRWVTKPKWKVCASQCDKCKKIEKSS